MELIILNVIAVVIILVVSIINIIIAINLQYKYNEQKILINSFKYDLNETQQDFKLLKKDVIDIIKSKIEKDVTINILDLEEFSKLDPYIKDLYKSQIVKILMPAVMNAINDQFYKENMDIKIGLHAPEIQKIIIGLANKIKKDGLQAIPIINNNFADAQIPTSSDTDVHS